MQTYLNGWDSYIESFKKATKTTNILEFFQKFFENVKLCYYFFRQIKNF